MELRILKFDNTHVTIDLDIISENFRAIREKAGFTDERHNLH